MSTRARLRCGAIAGPLFLLVVLLQDYTRPGFDPRVLPLSMLALGALGWVQILNFVGAGALNLLYAPGLRTRLAQAPGGVAVPASIGVYGLALIVVGVFRTDPATGFPPGSISPAGPSWHGFIHALVALPLFIALAMALVGFCRYFLRRGATAWAAYAGTSAFVMMGLFFFGVSHPMLLARLLRLATLIGWLRLHSLPSGCWTVMTRPNEFRQIVFSILLVASTHTVACTAAPYLMPQFKRGETYADVYSKSVIVTGEGFEPIVQRFDGTSTYLVTDAGPRVLRFDETDVTAGRLTPTNGRLEIRNGGNTNCYNGSCFLNTQTSGLIFIPLLWGTPSGTLEKDQTWTVQIPQPWEIGPAGIETVTVVTVDSTTRVAILQRDGRGNGPSEDDMRGLPITVNGRSGHATVDAGPSHWKGQLVVRAGVVLSDVVVAERQVTLKVDTRVFTGHERVITTLTAAPPMQ